MVQSYLVLEGVPSQSWENNSTPDEEHNSFERIPNIRNGPNKSVWFKRLHVNHEPDVIIADCLQPLEIPVPLLFPQQASIIATATEEQRSWETSG